MSVNCAPTCTINDSTFHGNIADTYGGAIMGDGHHDNNVTFADNTAGGHGGALFGGGYALNNTVFVGNSAHNPWGQAMSCNSTGTGSHVLQWLSSSADRSTRCISTVVGANPLLAAPAANGGSTLFMMPGANSPALNAGSGCDPRDQRGAARNTAVCDLGAVQRTPSTAPSASASAAPSAGQSAAAPPSLSNSSPPALRAVGASGPIGGWFLIGILSVTLGFIAAVALFTIKY